MSISRCSDATVRNRVSTPAAGCPSIRAKALSSDSAALRGWIYRTARSFPGKAGEEALELVEIGEGNADVPLPPAFDDDHPRRECAAQLLFGLSQLRTKVAAGFNGRVGNGGIEELRDALFRLANGERRGLLGEVQHHRRVMIGQRQQRLAVTQAELAAAYYVLHPRREMEEAQEVDDGGAALARVDRDLEIGRASCRERV